MTTTSLEWKHVVFAAHSILSSCAMSVYIPSCTAAHGNLGGLSFPLISPANPVKLLHDDGRLLSFHFCKSWLFHDSRTRTSCTGRCLRHGSFIGCKLHVNLQQLPFRSYSSFVSIQYLKPILTMVALLMKANALTAGNSARVPLP